MTMDIKGTNKVKIMTEITLIFTDSMISILMTALGDSDAMTIVKLIRWDGSSNNKFNNVEHNTSKTMAWCIEIDDYDSDCYINE